MTHGYVAWHMKPFQELQQDNHVVQHRSHALDRREEGPRKHYPTINLYLLTSRFFFQPLLDKATMGPHSLLCGIDSSPSSLEGN